MVLDYNFGSGQLFNFSINKEKLMGEGGNRDFQYCNAKIGEKVKAYAHRQIGEAADVSIGFSPVLADYGSGLYSKVSAGTIYLVFCHQSKKINPSKFKSEYNKALSEISKNEGKAPEFIDTKIKAELKENVASRLLSSAEIVEKYVSIALHEEESTSDSFVGKALISGATDDILARIIVLFERMDIGFEISKALKSDLKEHFTHTLVKNSGKVGASNKIEAGRAASFKGADGGNKKESTASFNKQELLDKEVIDVLNDDREVVALEMNYMNDMLTAKISSDGKLSGVKFSKEVADYIKEEAGESEDALSYYLLVASTKSGHIFDFFNNLIVSTGMDKLEVGYPEAVPSGKVDEAREKIIEKKEFVGK